MSTENSYTGTSKDVIQQLRNNGLKVQSVHYRLITMQAAGTLGFGYKFRSNGKATTRVMVQIPMPLQEIRRKGLQKNIVANGGYTTLRIINKDGSIDVTGEGKCHETDAFSNSNGFKNALNDAISQLPPEHRPIISGS